MYAKNGSLVTLIGGAMMTACGAGADLTGQPVRSTGASDTSPDALAMPGLAPGYQRFVTPAVELKPGESRQYLYWVAEPLAEESDILDVQGGQAPGGHHATLLATADIQPVGSSVRSTPRDTIPTQTLGGITGVEGTSVNLPRGIVFRVPAGRMLAIQAHYLNATRKPLTTRTYIDVKVVKADPSRIAARSLLISTTNFVVKAHAATTVDVHCPIERDLKLVLAGNHAHEHATSVKSEMTLADGTVTSVLEENPWKVEYTVNPDFQHYTLDHPLLLPKGAMFHVQCNWVNDSDQDIQFPDEMCGFIGFGPFDHEISCEEQGWQEQF